MAGPAWTSVAGAATPPCAVQDPGATHAYAGSGAAVTYCPTLGFGVGATWLFARAGNASGEGSGIDGCYGSTSAHHGAHTVIHVLDDALGGSVGFTVQRDWNRTSDNGLPGPGNADDASHLACGDGLVEPCPPGYDDTTPQPDPSLPGGCNHLDASEFVLPQQGICAGLGSLGTIDPLDPIGTLGVALGAALDLVNAILADPTGFGCAPAPGPNSWTVSAGTLADFAGADGTVLVALDTNARADAGHAGTATTGTVWTE